MRKVGSFDHVEKAESFRFYLISQNIETKLDDAEESTQDVWIYRDHDTKRARELYEEFLANPDSKDIAKSVDDARQKVRLISTAKAPASAPAPAKQTASTFKHKDMQSGGQGYGTLGLIALSALFFILHFLDRDRWLMRHLMISEDMLASTLGIKSFREIADGEFWRLVTPIFIHTDIFHIAFNMMWLYQLGRLVESTIGSLRYLLLILFIAVPSNVVFYLVSGPFFGGMSGVVYGLFFFMWAYDRYSLYPRYYLEPHLAQFFAVFYVLCWILSALGFHVANTVHGVGSFCGLLAGYFASGHFKGVPKPLRLSKVSLYNGLIVIALLAGGMLTDILTK